MVEISKLEPTLAIVVTFRDEEQFLPILLASFEGQTEPADEILLVDDGSVDRSSEIGEAFSRTRSNVRYLRRQRDAGDQVGRKQERDRLVSAPELRSFQWGVEQLSPGWEIVAKMDGDLELPPTLFEEVREAMRADEKLGIVGSYLSVSTPSGPKREHNPELHVRGPNKFYRRECLAAISPIPPLLGWDAIDELRARQRGWRTHPISLKSGDIIHLRPTGSHDGRLRAYWRWGQCAWGYGAHPLAVVAGAARRSLQPPYVISGLCYIAGWADAGVRRAERVDASTREFARAEDIRRIRAALRLQRKLG
jgi:hypothetical protein